LIELERLSLELGPPSPAAVEFSNPVRDESLRRTAPLELPQLSEPEVVRHFVRMSILNHHVDKAFYPLGSCTMKYNPKINEECAALPGFSNLHPLTPEEGCQGALRLMFELGEALKEVTGMDAVSLQPAAGAQGELTGMLVTRAYHLRRGDRRRKVLIPDSSHGTNPASVRLAGFEAVKVASGDDGLIHMGDLADKVDEDVAGMMLTSPNTLGLLESRIEEIARILHDNGALLYLDGANLNALVGLAKPGEMGFDLAHINLHKTFSTPHGGGGPGSGPLAVKQELAPFLPVPVVERGGDRYLFNYDLPESVGKVHCFYGNFLVMVKAYAYIRRLGAEGLEEVSRRAILNANYLLKLLSSEFEVPYRGFCMHEFVLSGRPFKANGVRTLDIAKRLLDFGVHAPTVYFPLIVDEALMIEPTETEGKRSLDGFAEAMKTIAREAERNPEKLRSAPITTPVGRLDEGRAARDLKLTWKELE